MKKVILVSLLLVVQTLIGQDLIPYRQGEFFGYTDINGTWKIPPFFDRAGWFSDGLAPVATGCNDCWDVYDGKWGYIDAQGKQVIPCEFDEANEFSDGLASARMGNVWGFIQKTGTWVISPRFSEVLGFSNGYAWVRDTNYLWGVIAPDGKYITPPVYDQIGIPKEGMVPVFNRFEWGYANSKGEIMMNFQFTSVTPFTKGKAVVQKGKNYFFIDLKGKVLAPATEAEFGWYMEPFALKRSVCPPPDDVEDGRISFGLKDASGNEVIPCGKYENIIVRNDHWAFVTNWKDGGWVNAEGRLFAEYPQVNILKPIISIDIPEVPEETRLQGELTYTVSFKIQEWITGGMPDGLYLVYVQLNGETYSILQKVPVSLVANDEGLNMGMDRPLTYSGKVDAPTLALFNESDYIGERRFLCMIRENLPANRLADQPLFKLYALGTNLRSPSGEPYFFSMSALVRASEIAVIKHEMLDAIHAQGNILASSTGGNPVITHPDPLINGKTLGEVMKNASTALLDSFVSFMISHPERYAGTDQTLTSAFENWLIGK